MKKNTLLMAAGLATHISLYSGPWAGCESTTAQAESGQRRCDTGVCIRTHLDASRRVGSDELLVSLHTLDHTGESTLRDSEQLHTPLLIHKTIGVGRAGGQVGGRAGLGVCENRCAAQERSKARRVRPPLTRARGRQLPICPLRKCVRISGVRMSDLL